MLHEHVSTDINLTKGKKTTTSSSNPHNTETTMEISVIFINFSNCHQLLLNDFWREKEETDKLNICRKQGK